MVRLTLKTGRTHQIRVHMKTLGYPLAGDSLYGGIRKNFSDCSSCLAGVHDPAVYREGFTDSAPIPKDFFDVFPEIKKMHEAEESIIS